MARLLPSRRALLAAAPLALLLVAGVTLVGCRESLVEPTEPVAPPSGPPPASANDMYVKGPDEMAVGETATYRAELLEETSGYQWGFGGEGSATTTDGTAQREFTLTALTPGYVIVNFRAFGEGGEVLGYAEKLVIIR